MDSCPHEKKEKDACMLSTGGFVPRCSRSLYNTKGRRDGIMKCNSDKYQIIGDKGNQRIWMSIRDRAIDRRNLFKMCLPTLPGQKSTPVPALSRRVSKDLSVFSVRQDLSINSCPQNLPLPSGTALQESIEERVR